MNGNYYNTYSENGLNSYQANDKEEDYIDNILKQNKGKKIKLYISIPGSSEYQNKEFIGILEQIGKDHIAISNPQTGSWNLIPLIYLAYIEFEEPINYNRHFYN